MIKIHFQAEELDFYAKGANIFLAIGQLEEKLKAFTGLERVLSEDPCIDWGEVVHELLDNDTWEEKTYLRHDFSDPECNFSLSLVPLSEEDILVDNHD